MAWRHRPPERLRRRLLPEPPGRPRARDEAARAVPRADLRAGFRRGCPGAARASRNVRLLEDQERRRTPIAEHDLERAVSLLVLDRDTGLEQREEMPIRHRRTPSEAQWGDMLFAMRACKHVRSNAIVLTKGLAGQHRRRPDEPGGLGADCDRQGRRGGARTRGRGDGFGRVLSVRRRSAGGHRRRGTGDHPAGRLSATAEVIAACDAADVAMAFTSRRHFRRTDESLSVGRTRGQAEGLACGSNRSSHPRRFLA